jgi:hypothetical protein
MSGQSGARLVLLLLLCSVGSAENPFDRGSDVITVSNAKQWRELESSPYLWFVNVCRQS